LSLRLGAAIRAEGKTKPFGVALAFAEYRHSGEEASLCLEVLYQTLNYGDGGQKAAGSIIGNIAERKRNSLSSSEGDRPRKKKNGCCTFGIQYSSPVLHSTDAVVWTSTDVSTWDETPR
jgi:hypothetical protein